MNTSLLIRTGTITINTFLPTRNKFIYFCSKNNPCFKTQWTLGKYFMRPTGCGSIFPAKNCWVAWRSSSQLAWDKMHIANEAKLRSPIHSTFEVLVVCSGALSRIGPLLLTSAGCRCHSFQCLPLMCWAYFSDVWFHWDSESCSGSDRQETTKQWPWAVFGCKFSFRKCFGVSSWSNHWACHHWLLYKIHFSSHVINRWRNGSLLLHTIREDNTSRWFFWFAVSSQDTHLSSSFTFPVCFTCQMTIEWWMLSSWATSRVVVRGSVGCCQLLMVGFYAPHLQGSRLLSQLLDPPLLCMFISGSCCPLSLLLDDPFWTWIRKLLKFAFYLTSIP